MRIGFDSLNDRPGDDVRERDLAAALRREMFVDDPAIFFEDLDRNVAKAGRRRDRQALLHVLDDLFRGAGDRFGLGVGGERHGGRFGSLGASCRRNCSNRRDIGRGRSAFALVASLPFSRSLK